MKVMHVHRVGGIGGSERHLLTLLPALAERGVDVSFLGLDDTSRAPDPFYEALTVPYERIRRARRVVEPEEADVDTALGECAAIKEMALGTADPADSVNVHDLHRRSRHLPNAHSSAAAARRAIRKSVATRYRVAPTKTIAATVWYANTASASATNRPGPTNRPDQTQRIEDGRVQRLRQAADRTVARVGRGGRRPRIPFHPHHLARKPRLLARMPRTKTHVLCW